MSTAARVGGTDAASASEWSDDAPPAQCQRTLGPLLLPVERRQTPRTTDAACHGVVSVRVRPGHQAVLLNVSLDGAAIETSYRLLPGSTVELQLDTGRGWTNLRGRVLRCAVVALTAHRVTYGGAVRFESPLPWLNRDPPEYAVPVAAGPKGT